MRIKNCLSIILCLTIPFFVMAQSPPAGAGQVVQWIYSAKKVADKTYEIHLTPTVQSPWHIYSQTSPEGGALPTKIHFNKNPLISIEGKPKEVGKIVSKYEEVFEVTVKYFEGKGDFVQVINFRKTQGDKPIKTTISGSIEYMACNDEQCLPPATVPFTISLN